MKRTLSFSVFVALFLATAAFADLVPLGPIPFSGTGLGSEHTILTVQNNPTESGCVAWNGTTNVIGAAACPPGIAGGNELTGSSQTQTRTIAELGLTSATDLRIVLNLNENTLDPVILQNMRLRIFSPAGAVLFDSGTTFVPVVDLFGSGTGQAGYVFLLTPAQAAAAQTVFAPTNRIGIAATLTGTTSGHETFFVAPVTGIGQQVDVADLNVTKTAPATAVAGNNITYGLTVTNAGTGAATTVRLQDVVPANTRFVSLAAPAGWTCTAPAPGGTGPVTCTTATLAAGATANFSLVVRSCGETPCPTTVTNTATVASFAFDPNAANNTAVATTLLQAQSDLSVTKGVTPSFVSPGQNVTFNVTVANAGPSTSVNTIMTDTLPAGFTAVSAVSTVGICSTATPGVVTCNIGTLGSANQCTTNAPTTAQITIMATVPANAATGSHTNTATVTSGNCLADAVITNNTTTVRFQVGPPSVGIPTASEWALLALALALAVAGAFAIKL